MPKLTMNSTVDAKELKNLLEKVIDFLISKKLIKKEDKQAILENVMQSILKNPKSALTTADLGKDSTYNAMMFSIMNAFTPVTALLFSHQKELGDEHKEVLTKKFNETLKMILTHHLNSNADKLVLEAKMKEFSELLGNLIEPRQNEMLCDNSKLTDILLFQSLVPAINKMAPEYKMTQDELTHEIFYGNKPRMLEEGNREGNPLGISLTSPPDPDMSQSFPAKVFCIENLVIKHPELVPQQELIKNDIIPRNTPAPSPFNHPVK